MNARTEDGVADGERTRRVIARIADAIGVSTDAFYAPDGVSEHAVWDEAAQALELLRLFASIEDEAVRMDCLAYLRCRASAAPGPTDARTDASPRGR